MRVIFTDKNNCPIIKEVATIKIITKNNMRLLMLEPTADFHDEYYCKNLAAISYYCKIARDFARVGYADLSEYTFYKYSDLH